MSSIKFSVTIPAYKGKYLSAAIKSVLDQTYDNFELIIVDDCSPENLKVIVDQYQDSRIHYYRNGKNCGAINVVDNWNICLSYCTGEYVICMGDDDRLKACCLKEYAKLIDKYPNVGVYHAWTEIIDENGQHKETLERRPEYESIYSLIYRRMRGGSQFIGDFCYNVEKLKSFGGFYKLPLAWCSDDISSYRAALKDGITNTQEICFEYRVSRLTISNSESENTIYLKTEALLEQHRWLESLIHSLEQIPKNEKDRQHYDYIQCNLKRFTSEEIAYWAMKNIKFKQSKMLYWIKYFNFNNLFVRVLIKRYLSFLYHKFLK